MICLEIYHLSMMVYAKLPHSILLLVSLATYCVDYPSSNGNVPINDFSSYNIRTLPPHAYTTYSNSFYFFFL